MEMTEYNANDIQTLDFRDAVRARIAMYMGSADNQGVLQCVREIITNSIDEMTMGFGDTITVELLGSEVTVSDNARGVPFGLRDDGTEAMEAIYTMPHTGGKFNEKVYQNVAGMNGIGSKGVALSSINFTATSFRDGQRATLKLEKGIKVSFKIDKIDNKSLHGTTVTFTPDPDVYNLEPIHINFEDLKDMCRNWSYLSKGVTFKLFNKDTNERVVYKSDNGILDFLKDSIKKPIHRTPLYINMKENEIECEVAMQWSADRNEHWYIFTNGLANSEGGTSLTGVRTALTNFFKKKLKGEFSADIARSGLYYVVNCKVPNPSFANQTKTKVNNPELRGLSQRAAGQMLDEFSRRYAGEFEQIMTLLTKELRAERAAEKARKQVLEASKEIEKNQKRKVFASDKLKDAEFLGPAATLLIVEGNSAMGGMSQARDYTKYGILAIRGKIINCLSNPEEKIFQNEEIKLLLSAMNIVPGKYNASKLRYGRIAICTDADSDGSHIGLLIMAALQYLAPQFIEEGRLCWLRSPLYIVNNGKQESYYFTDDEFNKVRNKIKGEVTRAKGLGELPAETAHASMFTPEYQRMDVMEWSDDAIDLLYDLMGEQVEPRKEFIMSKIDFNKVRE